MRLPTHIMVEAEIKKAFADGRAAVLIRRGEATSGTIVLKLVKSMHEVKVLTQAYDLDGNPAWLVAFGGKMVPESEADVYIERQLSRDPDLWAVEFEHPDAANPFEGKEL